MGFYGNITNTSNTTFQFDKIYPNRLSMDANVNNDGIFIGRYVLVEYDQDAAYPIIYTKDGINFYSSPNTTEEISRIKFKSGKRPASEAQSEDAFYLGEIGQVQDIKYNPDKTIKSIEINFYQCSNEEDDQDGENAIFSLLTKTSSNNAYINNFAIDEAYESRNEKFKGYDSTVWVKTTINTDDGLITKYVNIADMNSVVPTFDIAADAPTMTPITPHFDADSTNVYYKLHAQPQWGFRVAQTSADKSDETTQWVREFYDPRTDTTSIKYASEIVNEIPSWDSDTPIDLYAAIYFNEAGFKKQLIGTEERGIKINKHSATVLTDEIKVMPTGKSGIEYNNHNGQTGEAKSVQADTQELTINLPSIGNMMSDAWDIIHGPNRNDDMRQFDDEGNRVDSLQGRLNSIANMPSNQIPIKLSETGALVGTKINGDSQNNVSQGVLKAKLAKNWDTIDSKFKGDDAWIETIVDDTKAPDAIAIHHNFTSTRDTSSALNKNGTENNFKEPYYVKQDADGKWIEDTEATSKLDQELDLKRTQISAVLNKKGSETGKEDYIRLYTPYVDQAGHIVGRNIETVTLPYSFRTISTNGRGTSTNINATTSPVTTNIVADKTQDTLTINSGNKWVRLDTDATNDKITISHDIHTITNTITQENTDNLNNKKENNIQNTINIPDWDFDNAGHITHKSNRIYTLPYGYKTIEVNNSDAVTAAAVSANGKTQTADNTQDTIQFNASNKWIKLEAETEDTIKFGHLLSPLSAEEHKSSDIIITGFGDSFKILKYTTDEAGHVIASGEDEITIPKGNLNNFVATESSVLTGISMVPETGIITQTNADVGTLKLTQYTQGTSGALKINNSDTINGAFQSIQTYINELDMDESQSSTQFITSIKQVDGQITVSRANAGTLILGTESTDKTVSATDSLNSAINKIEARIKTEEENRKNAIDTLYGNNGEKIAETFDTIKEIADWLDNDSTTGDTGVEKLISDINNNAQAIIDETARADSAEKALGTRIDNLNYEKTQVNNYYISSIKQTNGLIEVGTTELPIRTVTSGTDNGTILVNGSAISVGGLKSAAFTESSAYATAEQGAAADNAVSKEVYEAKIKQLENKIIELENIIIEILENYPLPEEEPEAPIE